MTLVLLMPCNPCNRSSRGCQTCAGATPMVAVLDDPLMSDACLAGCASPHAHRPARVQVMQQSVPNYTETKRVRAVKVYNARIFDVCDENAPIADIDTNYWQLRVEPVPADDAEAEARCTAAGVEPVLALFSHAKAVEGATDSQLEDYGDPVALVVHPDDTLAQTVERCAFGACPAPTGRPLWHPVVHRS